MSEVLDRDIPKWFEEVRKAKTPNQMRMDKIFACLEEAGSDNNGSLVEKLAKYTPEATVAR